MGGQEGGVGVREDVVVTSRLEGTHHCLSLFSYCNMLRNRGALTFPRGTTPLIT